MKGEGGPSGQQGERGAPGDTGDQGLSGYRGDRGVPGPPGTVSLSVSTSCSTRKINTYYLNTNIETEEIGS